MTINTIAGLKAARRQLINVSKTAGVAGTGVLGSFWLIGGSPAAGAYPANTTTGVVPTSATAGAISFVDPASGDTTVPVSAKLSWSYSSGIEATYFLCDRLWHGGPFTPTSGVYAGLTGTALTRSTDAVGVELYAEITTALSATAHTLTITYTNQAGTAGRTATVTLPASAASSRVYQATLQAGDTGVSQVTGMSGSASPPTGAFGLFLAKTHTTIEASLRKGQGGIGPKSYLGLGSVPIPSGACLFLMGMSGGGTTPNFQAALELAHG